VPRGLEVGRGYIAVDVDEAGAHAQLRGFAQLGGQALGAITLAAGALTTAVATTGVQFNSLKEQASIAFTSLLHDGGAAQAFLAELTRFAATTPFELPGLIDNARQLLGVGLAADKVIPTLQSLGDAAGALGLNQEAFNRILLATSQAMSKGKLQGEELLQFAENGIPVFQLLAKALGKPVPEIQKLSSEGKLLAAEVLPKLFAQMSLDYGGAMAAQSKTLVGQWSTLKDTSRILAGTGFRPVFDEAKRVVGALGELAGSDDATRFAERFADRLDVAIDAAKRFGTGIRREFGGEVRTAIDQVSDRAADLGNRLHAVLEPALNGLVTVAHKALPALQKVGEVTGGVLRAGLDAAATVTKAFEEHADGLADTVETAGETIEKVGHVALPVLEAGLKVVALSAQTVLHAVELLNGPLGLLTGAVIAGAAAWKAYTLTASLATTAFGAIRPDAVAGRLKNVGSRVDDVALSAGVLTERFTGSARAGEKVATAGSRVGTALTRVGSLLPVVGIGAVAIGTAFELLSGRAKDANDEIERYATALNKGGQEGKEAQQHLDQLRSRYAELQTQIETLTKAAQEGRFSPLLVSFQSEAGGIKTEIDKITSAADRQRIVLTTLQEAQGNLAKAQADYSRAIRDFGEGSPQAAAAQQQVALAAAAVEREQRRAAEATKSHTDRMLEQAQQAFALANADLALRQAEAGVEQAQRAAADATAAHGARSAEAQQANLTLEQSMLAAADAAARKAQQENAGKSQTEQTTAATQAYVAELLKLASAAGTNAPPEILKLIAGLDSSQLAAFEAAAATGQFKTQVISLPDGRTVRIAVDDQGTPVVGRLYSQLTALERTWQVTVKILQDGRVPTGLFNIGPRAEGGPVRKGMPYLVGEKGLPELYVPDYNGWIYNGDQTRRLLSAMASTTRDPIVINNLHLRALSDRFELDQVQEELYYAGVR